VNALPEPLTPSDCDLRGLEYMPLLGGHLFGSEFNARANDSEWRAALTLWWAAWCQVPAASLPDDDAALCRFADLGRDLKSWRKLRQGALHGWVKCADGRLYHPVLAEQALIAWDKRKQDRESRYGTFVPLICALSSRITALSRHNLLSHQSRHLSHPMSRLRRDGTGRDLKKKEKPRMSAHVRTPPRRREAPPSVR
jgi:hypothetical protein